MKTSYPSDFDLFQLRNKKMDEDKALKSGS